MSLQALAVCLGAGVGAALFVGWWLKQRTPVEPRRPVGARYVAAPGFPQPLVHRVPGATIAAYRADPAEAQIAEWEDDDCIPAADIWVAYFPPGSLGEHPESAPLPGPLVAEPGDVTDLLTGVIRHLRAHAAHR